MGVEFEQPEQMDLSQPAPDFVLNPYLRGFKMNPKLAQVLLPAVLGIAAWIAGTVEGFDSDGGVFAESTPTGARTSLVTETPTPEPAKVEVVQTPDEPPIVIADGTGPILLCGNGEPACPSDKECKITAFRAAPGVIAMSGVCVDSDAGQ